MNIPLKPSDLIPFFLTVFAGALMGQYVISSFFYVTHNKSQIVSSPVNTSSYRPTPLIKQVISSSRQDLRELNGIITRLRNGQYPEDWEVELNRIQELTLNGDGSLEALIIFFSKWGENDFEAAFKMSEKLLDGYSMIIGEELLIQLAKNDIQKAISFYEDNKDALRESMLIYPLLGEISKRQSIHSPNETLAWGLSMTDTSLSLSVLFPLIHSLGYDSKDLETYLESIASTKPNILPNILGEWAAFNPDSAREWLEKNKENSNPETIKALLEGTSRNDIDKAIFLLNELPQEQQWALANSVAKYMNNDETALSWILKTVPSSEISESHLSRLNSWAKEDPFKAADWINSLNNPSLKDLATTLYIEHAPASIPYKKIEELLKNMQKTSKKSLLKNGRVE